MILGFCVDLVDLCIGMVVCDGVVKFDISMVEGFK